MAGDGLKHVVHRRVHLERSQPEHRRRRVGQFLEKKQDYRRRAARYHTRERIIRELSSKARFRNEDEFNFKMIHGRIGDQGQVILESEESAKRRKLTAKQRVRSEVDAINRNLFVLNHKENMVRKKIGALAEENPGLVREGGPLHIIYPDDEDGLGEADAPTSAAARTTTTTSDTDTRTTTDATTTTTHTTTATGRATRSARTGTTGKTGGSSSSGGAASKGACRSKGGAATEDESADLNGLNELSEVIDKNRELETIRRKLLDRRELALAKYKKRQVRRVRGGGARVYEFVPQRQK